MPDDDPSAELIAMLRTEHDHLGSLVAAVVAGGGHSSDVALATAWDTYRANVAAVLEPSLRSACDEDDIVVLEAANRAVTDVIAQRAADGEPAEPAGDDLAEAMSRYAQAEEDLIRLLRRELGQRRMGELVVQWRERSAVATTATPPSEAASGRQRAQWPPNPDAFRRTR